VGQCAKFESDTRELHEVERQLSSEYNKLKTHYQNLALVEHHTEEAWLRNLKVELEIRLIEKELCQEESPYVSKTSHGMTPCLQLKREMSRMSQERTVLREQVNKRGEEAFLLEMKLASLKVDAERVRAEAAAVQAEKAFSERQSKDNKEFQGNQRVLESK